MSGIYIHIPFCTQACHYCDFHFSTSFKTKEKLLFAMVEEIRLRKEELGLNISSLYFGGGTPSVLKKSEINIILEAIKSTVDFKKIKEITIEVNPEDISINKLKEYKKLGFNRLSIGIQSMDDKLLKWMNRVHNKQQALKTIDAAKTAGITNFNLDFIYGFPAHLKRDYKKELMELLALNPNHISCYHLTVEQGTYFGKLKAKNKWIDVDDEKSEEEFLWISKTLKEADYHHYEISNFAKKNYQSFHNSNYWKQESYFGIGPSAHSYNNKKRRWNISNNNLYIKKVIANQDYFEQEQLSEIDLFNEKLMLGLRTENGVSISALYKYLDENQKVKFKSKLNSLTKDGLLTFKNNSIKIPQNKWLLSEYVSREFFILNE